mmetsp:Transcript_29503/g.74228  ORF Transcript_29503/g.74228 Transcript_29503/m.74228 type:complete len:321 (+) Transcript_29503:168-1130(+)
MTSRDLDAELDLIVRFHLRERGFVEVLAEYDKKTRIFFDTELLREYVRQGKWDEFVDYILPFVNIEDPLNEKSVQMIWEVRKQQFYELLDSGKKPMAIALLANELSAFSDNRPDLFQALLNVLNSNFGEYVAKEEPAWVGSRHPDWAEVSGAWFEQYLREYVQPNTALAKCLIKAGAVKPRHLRNLVRQALLFQVYQATQRGVKPDDVANCKKTLLLDLNEYVGTDPTPRVEALLAGLETHARPVHYKNRSKTSSSSGRLSASTDCSASTGGMPDSRVASRQAASGGREVAGNKRPGSGPLPDTKRQKTVGNPGDGNACC